MLSYLKTYFYEGSTVADEFDIITFLKQVVVAGASDIHLHVDEYPVIRKNGRIIKIDMPKLTEQDINNSIAQLMPEKAATNPSTALDFDCSFEIKDFSRFRVNFNRQLGKPAFVIRTIPCKVKTINELNLPPAIENFATYNNGLVLITGPTGSGKSTTIASLIEHVNLNYQKHIITLEDPIEFVFTSKKSIISQRQINVDTPSFNDGVKYAMRQDPDVILIGEIRDRETITNALKAAETGHLVFATLHTNNAIQTISRIINMFEPQDRDSIRDQLANSLRGTVSQKLVACKNNDRCLACEILVNTSTITDLIVKGRLDDIYSMMQKGSFNDMMTMNMSLYYLVEKDLISEEEAMEKSDNKIELQQLFKGVYQGTN